ncbi:MAG: nitroreductase family protein [Bacilli bacterium]|nr:nitroreductase family protein [Bacilli bacterium]
MDFLELAKARYSVRKFSSEPVRKVDLNLILKAGHLAPTACNKQPQHIIVIDTTEGLSQLKKCTTSHFNCSLAFLVCYDTTQCWVREFDGKNSGEVDASIVATHMMLEAASIGVGSTWVMHFIPEAIVEEFSLPPHIIPVAILVMGYPALDAHPSSLHHKFRDEKELIHFYNPLK